ncbi:unnamed protein product, partial [marine sediment metagenome]
HRLSEVHGTTNVPFAVHRVTDLIDSTFHLDSLPVFGWIHSIVLAFGTRLYLQAEIELSAIAGDDFQELEDCLRPKGGLAEKSEEIALSWWSFLSGHSLPQSASAYETALV